MWNPVGITSKHDPSLFLIFDTRRYLTFTRKNDEYESRDGNNTESTHFEGTFSVEKKKFSSKPTNFPYKQAILNFAKDLKLKEATHILSIVNPLSGNEFK